MRVKITNLQNEEITIDVVNIRDITIESVNGTFQELDIKDISDDLCIEQLELFQDADIKEYVTDNFKDFKFNPEVIVNFEIKEVINVICDEFCLEPKDIVTICPEFGSLEWKIQ